MRHTFLRSVAFVFLTSAVSLGAISTAWAGFEFVTPMKDRPASNAEIAAPAVRNDPVTGEALPEPAPPVALSLDGKPLTPVVAESDALQISDELPSAPVAGQNSAQNSAQNTPRDIARGETLSLNDSQGHTVQGFGRQVPLVMALQQIVPPNFRYSFGPGVVAGARINWTGGKPWKAVVADIARRNDMNVEIVDNVIALRRQNPMDIIAAQVTETKPVASQQALALPTPLSAPASRAPTPWLMASADLPPPLSAPKADMRSVDTAPVDAPMSLLEKPVLKEKSKETSVQHDKVKEDTIVDETVKKLAAAEKQPAKKGFFDRLFDMDKPAPAVKPMEQKKIVVDGEVVANIKADMKKDETVQADVVKVDNPVIAIEDLPHDTVKKVASKKETQKEPQKETVKSVEKKADKPVQVAEANVIEWKADKGQTVRNTLIAWSKQEGVSLVWSSQYDYPLQTDVRIQGAYPEAVRTLLAGFSKAQPRPLGRLFRNKSAGAKPVLVIETERLAQ